MFARDALPRRPRMVYCLAKETARQMKENHETNSIGDGQTMNSRPVGGGSGRRKEAGGSRLGMVVKGLLVVALLGIAFWGGMWSCRQWQRRARTRTRAESGSDVAVAREKAILGVTSEVFIEFSPKPQTISEEMVKVDVIKFIFGLTNGVDLAAIPYDERRTQALRKYPEIKDVLIERQLPRRVNINVIERVPAVRLTSVKSKRNPGLVADYDGVVFRNVIIRGLPAICEDGETHFKRGDRLEGFARAALQLVRVLADAADGKSDAAPGLKDLRVLEIDTSKKDYLLVTLSDSSTVEIAWDHMWEDSEISRQSLRRQLTRLAQAISAKLTPRATRWIVTEYQKDGRIYAVDPARRGER